MKGEVADGKGAGRVRGGAGAFSKGGGGIHAGDFGARLSQPQRTRKHINNSGSTQRREVAKAQRFRSPNLFFGCGFAALRLCVKILRLNFISTSP
jgi:hypothetical protein